MHETWPERADATDRARQERSASQFLPASTILPLVPLFAFFRVFLLLPPCTFPRAACSYLTVAFWKRERTRKAQKDVPGNEGRSYPDQEPRTGNDEQGLFFRLLPFPPDKDQGIVVAAVAAAAAVVVVVVVVLDSSIN